MQEQVISIFDEEPRLEYASFWARVGAMLIDYIILGIATSLIGLSTVYLFTDIKPGHSVEYYGKLVGIYLFRTTLYYLYFAIMESSSLGATLGKRALNIRVTDIDGNRISFIKATGRYFAKIISAIILFIGYIMVAFDDRKQGLHDRLAGTLVVKN